MPKFILNKLIRDKNLAKFEAGLPSKSVEYKELDEEGFQQEIFAKLNEEVAELTEYKDIENLVEEVGDVVEVLRSICEFKGIDWQEVESKRLSKLNLCGGFNAHKKVLSIDLPEGYSKEADEWIEYCRRDPSKYPVA